MKILSSMKICNILIINVSHLVRKIKTVFYFFLNITHHTVIQRVAGMIASETFIQTNAILIAHINLDFISILKFVEESSVVLKNI